MLNTFYLKIFAAEDSQDSLGVLNSMTATRAESFIKRAARYALVRIGMAIGFCLPWKNSGGLFFFFPFYSIGGAEKVHAEIVASVKEQRVWVFFANKSSNKAFKFLFEKNARIFDISFLADYFFTYYLILGVLTAFINRHANALVFGCNNVFFYHLISYLKRDVPRIDLVHCFRGGIEHVSLPFVPQIDVRVVIDHQTRLDLEAQYAAHNVDSGLLQRIRLIENSVAVPDSYTEKRVAAPLKVLYVGRGENIQKRVYLLGRAAAQCLREGIAAEFIFVGDVLNSMEPQDRNACFFKGAIAAADELNKLYAEAHVIVLASTFEGFPMVVMEAMAHGVVPVSTAVGGIPFHVEHGINGLLIRDEDEAEIVQSIVNEIKRLANDRALLGRMSLRAYEHARAHFTSERFQSAYRKLLLEQRGGRSE